MPDPILTFDSVPREISLPGIEEYRASKPAQQYNNSIENPLQYSNGKGILGTSMYPTTPLQTFEDNAAFNHLVSMRFYDMQGYDSTQPVPENAVFSFPELKIDTMMPQVSSDNYVPNPDVMQYAELEIDLNPVFDNKNYSQENQTEYREPRRQNAETEAVETVVQQDNLHVEKLEDRLVDGKYFAASDIMRAEREDISEDYQDFKQAQYIMIEDGLDIAVKDTYSAAEINVIPQSDFELDFEPRITYDFDNEIEESAETEVSDVYQVRVELQPSVLEDVAGRNEIEVEILSPESMAALKNDEPVAKSYLDDKIKTREMPESWKRELESMENEFQSKVSYAKIDMKTGEYEGHNDDEAVHPASMSKVGIMYALLYLSVNGKLNLNDKVQNTQEKRYRFGTERHMDAFKEDGSFTYLELIDFMIRKSSNYATGLILDAVTHDKINGTMDELGYLKTKFKGFYSKDGGYEENRTTMKEMAYMMYHLINGKDLDKEHKDIALNAMSNIIDYIVQADYDPANTFMKHGQTGNSMGALLKMQHANDPANHVLALNVNSQQKTHDNNFQYNQFGRDLYNAFVDAFVSINKNQPTINRQKIVIQ